MLLIFIIVDVVADDLFWSETSRFYQDFIKNKILSRYCKSDKIKNITEVSIDAVHIDIMNEDYIDDDLVQVS